MTQYQRFQAYLYAHMPKPRLTVTPNHEYRRRAMARRNPARAVKYYAAVACVNDPFLAMVTDNARKQRVQAAREWAQDHGEKLVDIAYRACFQPPLDAYDAGLLNDFGGGDVHWWQDYIRDELARAHEFYQSQMGEI
jgi:hypothetical protein